jgi:hypothetical protein
MDQGYRPNSVFGFTDYQDIGFCLEDHAQPGAYHRLVISK